MTQQLRLSTLVCLCPLLLPLASVGPGLCGGKKRVGNYQQVGTDWSSVRTRVWELISKCWRYTRLSCFLSPANPAIQKPLWSRVSRQCCCDHACSAWMKGHGLRPLYAWLLLPHHHYDIIETHTHTSVWKHSAPESTWAATSQQRWHEVRSGKAAGLCSSAFSMTTRSFKLLRVKHSSSSSLTN